MNIAAITPNKKAPKAYIGRMKVSIIVEVLIEQLYQISPAVGKDSFGAEGIEYASG
jgi:hypothetical protein